MERNIIVVDDFYDDPDEVRNFGLIAEYPDPGDRIILILVKIHVLVFIMMILIKKWNQAVGAGLEPSEPCGYFRISFEHDSLKARCSCRSWLGLGWCFICEYTRTMY